MMRAGSPAFVSLVLITNRRNWHSAESLYSIVQTNRLPYRCGRMHLPAPDANVIERVIGQVAVFEIIQSALDQLGKRPGNPS